ncbi:hypothetical protein DFR29_14110 [Tahibacter aquaticus]|uniref:HEAT repeat protein n=1 Tax=Tahibacter aquaticus TaxID=520092 RepID=A0A4V3DKK4_9GAMM|nr:hypothetical protein [Tahibacter aquaticus]TDR34964.1 hypothetical protein DFR29_14110 [Tahibacter aquaticus]
MTLALPIRALVNRHAGDAAFYWCQRQGSLDSPLVDLDRLAHLDRVLQAHLDGLVVAQESGTAEAWAALDRWCGAGEIFVCAVLALEQQDSGRLRAVWQCVAQQPSRRTDAFVAALAWAQDNPMGPRIGWIEHWSRTEESPLLRAAALRAARLCTLDVSHAAIAASRANDAELRAAACVALAQRRAQLPEVATALEERLRDDVLTVRIEAAIALLDSAVAPEVTAQALNVLGNAIGVRLQALAALTGGDRAELYPNVQRELRSFALHLPCGSAEAHALCSLLDVPDRIEFAAWHGDAALLAPLIELAADPRWSALVLWAVCALSGVDGDAAGLSTLPDTDAAIPSRYIGLPAADPVALSHWWSLHCRRFVAGTRYLLGAPVAGDTAAGRLHLLHVLGSAPQDLRSIAACHLQRAHVLADLSLLARATAQYQWLHQQHGGA